MLLSLTVENWLSFRDATTLSLKASRERLNNDTLRPLPKKYAPTKALPLAAIYGPNSAGKTALFSALSFIRQLIVRGSNPDERIQASPFLLDKVSNGTPTTISVELLIEEQLYRYSISTTTEKIIQETLTKVLSKSDSVLFNRGTNSELHRQLNNDLNWAILDTLPDNQSFINAAVRLGNETLSPIYNWFANTLQLISLDASFNGYSKMIVRDDFMKFADEILQTYTGIDGIALQNVEDDGIKEDLEYAVKQHAKGSDAPLDGMYQIVHHRPSGNTYYFVETRAGEIEKVSRMAMRHKLDSGTDKLFDIRNESAGTQRLIDLMPALFDLEVENNEGDSKVYVIDEIDRSFHTALTYGLIERFLSSCNSSTSKQLIFNLHDISLMDSGLFRKDEMWVCDKQLNSGVSHIICVGNRPDTRSDSNILRAYKANRYGGFPTATTN